jgi:hypothetical protein
MTPIQRKIAGQTLIAIAAILAGLAAIINAVAPVCPDDLKGVLLPFAVFLTALSVYLAHKNTQV